MALDTAQERKSVLSARFGRLPFGRRFSVPVADSMISLPDRQMLAYTYSGIVASGGSVSRGYNPRGIGVGVGPGLAP